MDTSLITVKSNDLTNMVRALQPIVSAHDMENASYLLRAIASLKKEIKDVFDPIKKSTADAHKKAVETEKRFLKPVEEADKRVRALVLVYQEMEKAKQRELEKARTEHHDAIMREALEGNGDALIALADAGEKPKTEGISQRVNYKYEIVDINQVPREYMIPDEKKIAGVVRATRGEINIPGIRCYIESSLVVKN